MTEKQKNSSDPKPVFEPGLHVYSTKAAFCLEPLQRETDSEHEATLTGLATIQIAVSTAPRDYDWANKLVVKLTLVEMMSLLGVFRGKLKRAEFVRQDKNGKLKTFVIEDQATNYYAQFKSATGYVVQIPNMEGASIALLLIRLLCRHYPGIPVGIVVAEVDYACSRQALKGEK